ncbi:MAG: extracellular solute-binding protein, partial [Chloroflexota bacterium]|nr:extracellular solute-binding protein [Chloroflexota bacterium]
MNDVDAKRVLVSRVTRRRWIAQGTGAIGSGGIAVLAAACSAGGGSSDNQPGAANAQPVTVRYIEETVPEGQAFAAEFNKRFNAKFAPRITAVTEPHAPGSWAERFEKYTAMAVGGTLPDVSWLATNFLRPFMLSGVVRDLDAFIKKDWKQPEIDDFYKGLF